MVITIKNDKIIWAGTWDEFASLTGVGRIFSMSGTQLISLYDTGSLEHNGYEFVEIGHNDVNVDSLPSDVVLAINEIHERFEALCEARENLIMVLAESVELENAEKIYDVLVKIAEV